MRFRILSALLVVLGSVAAVASADDLQWVVDVELGSAYVWRGQVVNDELVLQPAVTASWQGFSLNLWGNLDLTDSGDRRGDLTELDLTGSYGGEAGAIAWEVGVISYLFPDAGGDTWEAYAAASVDALLAPSFTLYYDFDEVDGYYAAINIGHGFELNDRSVLDLGLGAGWGDGSYHRAYLGVDEATLADALADAALTVQLSERTSLGVTLRYSWLWDSAIRAAARGAYGDDGLLFGSIVLSIEL